MLAPIPRPACAGLTWRGPMSPGAPRAHTGTPGHTPGPLAHTGTPRAHTGTPIFQQEPWLGAAMPAGHSRAARAAPVVSGSPRRAGGTRGGRVAPWPLRWDGGCGCGGTAAFVRGDAGCGSFGTALYVTLLPSPPPRDFQPPLGTTRAPRGDPQPPCCAGHTAQPCSGRGRLVEALLGEQ